MAVLAARGRSLHPSRASRRRAARRGARADATLVAGVAEGVGAAVCRALVAERRPVSAFAAERTAKQLGTVLAGVELVDATDGAATGEALAAATGLVVGYEKAVEEGMLRFLLQAFAVGGPADTAEGEGDALAKRVVLVTRAQAGKGGGFSLGGLFGGGGDEKKFRASEELLREGCEALGLEYAIVRPGKLRGGPLENPDYVAYLDDQVFERDFQGLSLQQGLTIEGDCTRVAAARAVLAALDHPGGDRAEFAVASAEGTGSPAWEAAFGA